MNSSLTILSLAGLLGVACTLTSDLDSLKENAGKVASGGGGSGGVATGGSGGGGTSGTGAQGGHPPVCDPNPRMPDCSGCAGCASFCECGTRSQTAYESCLKSVCDAGALDATAVEAGNPTDASAFQ